VEPPYWIVISFQLAFRSYEGFEGRTSDRSIALLPLLGRSQTSRYCRREAQKVAGKSVGLARFE
ncbi:MAG TPA: hypothetical protein VIS99_01410, partial [Terrimicrobiaceae bacterium]